MEWNVCLFVFSVLIIRRTERANNRLVSREAREASLPPPPPPPPCHLVFCCSGMPLSWVLSETKTNRTSHFWIHLRVSFVRHTEITINYLILRLHLGLLSTDFTAHKVYECMYSWLLMHRMVFNRLIVAVNNKNFNLYCASIVECLMVYDVKGSRNARLSSGVSRLSHFIFFVRTWRHSFKQKHNWWVRL